ncbi:MAG: hypothetical protein ABSA85_14710 [Terracidiphilus sp.]|jgi:hypothetical protein
MFIRKISSAVVGCGLLLVSTVSFTQNSRGPSTAEERQQALQYIQDFQLDPLSPRSIQEREWTLKWVIEVPDIHVNVCLILDKLPKGDKKDSGTIFSAQVLSQTAFVLQNPSRQDDRLAEYQAGVEGALHVYEQLLKANPKDRQPYLDDLIQRRDAGTLAQFVKERAEASCKN